MKVYNVYECIFIASVLRVPTAALFSSEDGVGAAKIRPGR